MRVVIHADASSSIGIGHVIRTLALASALRDEGAEVRLESDEMIDELRPRAAALGVTLAARGAQSRGADWVVFDSYGLDASDRARLRPSTARALVIDDLGGRVDDGSLVLNQNLYATPARPTRPNRGAELLAGPTYALLRPEFRHLAPERPQPARADRILVTMGGADPGNATATVIEALANLEPAPAVRIIVGAAHPSSALLQRLADARGFTVVRDAESLAPHLAWADLVVSGCGTSVLEAMRGGRPLVGLVLAENQEAVADALEQGGLGAIAGWHPGVSPAALTGTIDTARADRTWRDAAAALGPVLVDGRGAPRVAEVMRTGPLHLRDATVYDAELLLGWRNEPAVRAASFDRRPVDTATHSAWLERQLASASSRIWIGSVQDRPVGSVRFDVDGAAATISVAIAAQRRSFGIGTRLISMGCTRLASEDGVRAVDAWIRQGNAASETAFRRAGFRLADDVGDRCRYRLALENDGIIATWRSRDDR